MNISSRFDQFVASLRPSVARIEQANQQSTFLIQSLKNRIAEDGQFVIEKVVQAGSNAKHTALRSTPQHTFDVDLGVYFRGRKATKEQLDVLLRFIREQLPNIYPGKSDTDFTIHGSAVRVCFRTNKLHIDLVPIIRGTPALALPLSNVENGGWIPRHDGWRWTSITCHVDFVRRRTMLSKQVSGPVRFNKLVRLIKCWNNRQGNLKQSSYFCELVTAAALEKEGVTNTWQTSLYRIFSFLATNQLRQPIVFSDYYDRRSLQLPSDHIIVLDTVNPTNNLTSSWKEQKRQDYMRMVKQTYETVRQACDEERRGNEDAAVQAWCQVFEDAFRHVQR